MAATPAADPAADPAAEPAHPDVDRPDVDRLEVDRPHVDRLELVEVLAALGHPVRLEIVRRLASGSEAFCGEVVPDLPRSSVTHHLKTLYESGVITRRPAGRRLYLALRRDDLELRFPGLLALVLG
ncbi:ArsR/SmtB family transcription factor [Streptomyces sp. NPDC054949]|uniref:ArsR/SmtB family transcription factor n=1 Tax=unclassified Streptomyces TaxID=2593676 RepID=UPI00225B19D1|nr:MULTISPECIES: helix-turn-helix domain-containing protein [unclassified Streptomyces]MCX5073796.1 helix-turn-helix domain-containing protein [Streptomyces sp. NBC_00424]MCX5154652.1 helix-turn-helix domain-containing protein [Streptomyces sp. NBC_00291]WUD42983.1 helix-turn-helix domain-containing protein [Streptomyces sp. NBC_00513]